MVLTSVLALVIVPMLGVAPTMANPPSPPYRAFALWDNSGVFLPQGMAKTFDPTNATIYASLGAESFGVDATTQNQGWYDFRFSAPIGGLAARRELCR